MSEDETTVSSKPITRDGGYLDLADYGALGDGRSVALVGRDGRVDWWPVPALDSPPGFAALLDPDHGGYIALAPAEAEWTSSQRYCEGTNVLLTRFETSSGVAEVTDALTVGHCGPLPWSELQRRVRCVAGSVALDWRVRPGNRFATASPWVQPDEGGALGHVGDQHLGIRAFGPDGQPTAMEVAHQHAGGRLALADGEEALLVVTSVDDEPVLMPGRASLDRRFEGTVSFWRAWSADIAYQGRWAGPVARSALALKLLCYQPSGAIAAAATTSLPERVGGGKNWDYRYAWLRDCSFTVDALMELGLEEEVHAAVSWLLSCLASTAPRLAVFYRLDGGLPDDAIREVDVPGYRASRPVRSGNVALNQLQLGVYGDLFATLWRYVEDGNRVDDATAHLIARLADRCCDSWMEQDSGIWELPDRHHYTFSKIGCWVALDRAVKLADAGQLTRRRAPRWSAERDCIRDWVQTHCWDPERNSYLCYAGADGLDAALLLAGRLGFDRGPRLAGTVAAIQAELAEGPLVYRYTGMPAEEGAFLACSFWLVDALVRLDRLEEAAAQMDAAVGLCTSLGLLAEQMDPASGAMLGNLPQGLSHLALINAATAYDRALRSRADGKSVRGDAADVAVSGAAR